MLSNVTKKNNINKVAYAINWIKDKTGHSKILSKKRDDYFSRASEISEILQVSEHDEAKEDQHPFNRILSKFKEGADSEWTSSHKDISENNGDNSPLDDFSANKDFMNQVQNLDFHKKIPLSIDIVESEQEETEVEVVNQEKKLWSLNQKADQIIDEENDNYTPWIGKVSQNISPFENIKKNLIINTDSINETSMKQLQK